MPCSSLKKSLTVSKKELQSRYLPPILPKSPSNSLEKQDDYQYLHYQ